MEIAPVIESAWEKSLRGKISADRQTIVGRPGLGLPGPGDVAENEAAVIDRCRVHVDAGIPLPFLVPVINQRTII